MKPLKKLIAIICVLLVIFVAMYIYTGKQSDKNVTLDEVSKIEDYISKIYMWQEVTNQALPTFTSINDAPDKWVWEVVKKNLNNYDEIATEQISDEAKELFGPDFTKQFPKEGNDSFIYNNEQDIYQATNIELDSYMDNFLLNSISKTKDGYEVEILEYIEDYSAENDLVETNQDEFLILIKNLEGQELAKVKNTEGKDKIIEVVKENTDKLTKKTIDLKIENEKLFIRMVK